MPLTSGAQRLSSFRVKTKTMSFREIQDAHRKNRAADARALKSGKISAEELQETNSFIPVDASIRIADLAAYVRNREKK